MLPGLPGLCRQGRGSAPARRPLARSAASSGGGAPGGASLMGPPGWGPHRGAGNAPSPGRTLVAPRVPLAQCPGAWHLSCLWPRRPRDRTPGSLDRLFTETSAFRGFAWPGRCPAWGARAPRLPRALSTGRRQFRTRLPPPPPPGLEGAELRCGAGSGRGRQQTGVTSPTLPATTALRGAFLKVPGRVLRERRGRSWGNIWTAGATEVDTQGCPGGSVVPGKPRVGGRRSSAPWWALLRAYCRRKLVSDGKNLNLEFSEPRKGSLQPSERLLSSLLAKCEACVAHAAASVAQDPFPD